MQSNYMYGEPIAKLLAPELGYIQRYHGLLPPNFHPVNKPSHYNRKGIEAITAIEASMSDSEFMGYLSGNCIKYLWRYKYKNGLEDLKKCQWYLNKLIEKYETLSKVQSDKIS